MKSLSILFPVLALCAMLTSCSSEPAQKTIYAMDTAAAITVYGRNAADALAAAEAEIYRLDAELSRSGERGEIWRLNNFGSGTVSDETAQLVDTAIDVSRSTNGAFDITVTPLMDAWGFFGHEYRVPAEDEIDRLLSRVNYENIILEGNNLTLKNGAEIDLGGIAKGYAGEKAAQTLRNMGIASALISFNSSIQAVGAKPDGSGWVIGLANPQNTEEFIATLTLIDTCMSTSGSYEQTFEEDGKVYHHIIDPETGYPAKSGLASVSVIGGGAARADALSTALFVMGLDKASDYWRNSGGFEAVFITEDNELYYTPGLEEIIAVPEEYTAHIIM